MTKARWIPDPIIEETDRGNGMTELTYIEPPEKEIQYFQWDKPKQKRHNEWVYVSLCVTAIAGCAAVIVLPFMPYVAVPTILGCLGWLGLVGYANSRKEKK